MVISAGDDKVFIGSFIPRRSKTGTVSACNNRGEVVAVFDWDKEDGLLCMYICPSGDWPDFKVIAGMVKAMERDSAAKAPGLKVERVPPEYFDKYK